MGNPEVLLLDEELQTINDYGERKHQPSSGMRPPWSADTHIEAILNGLNRLYLYVCIHRTVI